MFVTCIQKKKTMPERRRAIGILSTTGPTCLMNARPETSLIKPMMATTHAETKVAQSKQKIASDEKMV